MSEAVALPEAESVIARMKELYPASPEQVIPLLQFVQGELGYLPAEAMAAIAEYVKVPASQVYGVATFYTQFRFKPLGKHRIIVCRGTACHVRGSARLVEEIERELKIKAGDTTPDLMFSIEAVSCVGSCALAPVVLINDRVYGKVTLRRMRKIIEERRGVRPSSPAAEKRREAAPQPVPSDSLPEAEEQRSDVEEAAAKTKLEPRAAPRVSAQRGATPPKKVPAKTRSKKPVGKKTPAKVFTKTAKEARKKGGAKKSALKKKK